MPELTVAAGPVRGLMELAVSKGAPRQALGERCGVDPRDLEDQDNRIPFANYIALMRAAKELCGDPALALHFAEETELAEMSILALLGPASETMADAFGQFNRYVRLVIEVELETADRFQLKREESGVWIVDTRLNPNAFPELTESTFARIVCSMRTLAAGSRASTRASPLKAVHVTHADPGYRGEYERIFAAPVVFESDKNALLLDNAILDYRVPAQPRYVFGVLSERAEALLKSLEESKSARGRLEKLLMPIVHKGVVGIETVAEKLGVSRWTLSRQLKAEGVTFERVLDELRCKLALHYLSGKKVSVNETAYLVGFSEPAAFSRAFKRWTGKSPREMTEMGQ
jgi:AraC-like DNA-binding protein